MKPNAYVRAISGFNEFNKRIDGEKGEIKSLILKIKCQPYSTTQMNGTTCIAAAPNYQIINCSKIFYKIKFECDV